MATSKPVTLVAASYSAKTTATKGFASVTTTSPVAVILASGNCATALTSAVNDDTISAGDSAVVSGTLTRTAPGGSVVPAAGEKVTIYSQVPSATTWKVAGTATTTASGSYAATIKPLETAKLQARFAARKGFDAVTGTEIPVTVTPRSTTVT